MSGTNMSNDAAKTNPAEQLEQTIAALEAQRALLGDSVTDAALAPLREKLAALRQQTVGEQRKLVTVLFADLVGFTSLAETMDPEDVREIVAAYFNRWTTQIEQFGGVVEKFIGDAVMAVFGLQTAREDDSERAIRAALAMRDELEALNRRLGQERDLQLAMRVGIHTGQVVVSLLDERKGQDFVIVGDTVNLTSRLQEIAPTNGILISHDTYRLVSGLFNLRALEPVQVKGRQEVVQTYLVLGAKPRSFRREKRSVGGVETHMVGRAAELEALQTALRQSIANRQPELVLVVGEAGIGKSRLMEAYEDWLDLLPETFLYFKGRASPYLQKQPYALLRDLFAFRFQIQDSDPTAVVREKLETGIERAWEGTPGTTAAETGSPDAVAQEAAHYIGHLLGFDFGPSPYLQRVEEAAQQVYAQALVYLGEYFRRLASIFPVVVLLEDLHWADESSLAALPALRQELTDQPVVIAATARPTFLERLPNWGEDQPRGQRLTLQPLREAESRQLLDEILQGVENAPETLYRLIADHAEGNPFYIEELIKMLIEEGTIVRQEAQPGQPARWKVETDRLATLRIPPTLAEVLQARFDSLPIDQRLLLQRASVVGRTFWDQALEFLRHQAGGPSGRSTPEMLNQLRHREIILQREESAFSGTQEYQFAHALLRDVTYESLLRRQRRLYHAHAAQWLVQVTERSQRADEYAALIAEHFEQADEAGQAAAWYERAGRGASAHYANAEAVHNLSRALELTPPENPRKRFDLLIEREKVFDRLGNRTAQQQDLEALHALAEQINSRDCQIDVLLRQANYTFMTSSYPDSIEFSQKAIALAQAEGDTFSEASGYLWSGRALAWQGEHTTATEHLERAYSLVQAPGTAAAQQAAPASQVAVLEAEVVRNLAIVALNQSDFARAYEFFQHSLDLYRKLGDRGGESAALAQLGIILLNRGDYAGAKSTMEAALQVARQMGFRYREGVLQNNLGIIAYEQGRFLEARCLYEATLKINRDTGDRNGEAGALTNLGDVARDLGQWASAEAYYETGLSLARETNDRMLESQVLSSQNLLLLQSGRVAEAIRIGQESKEIAITLEAPFYVAIITPRLAHAELAGGLLDQAEEHYRTALEIQRQLEMDSREMETRAGLARVAAARSRSEPAQAEMEAEALSQVEQILAWLENRDLIGVDEPAQVFLTCYEILEANRDERALALLERGWRQLQERARQIEDEGLRRSFLENVPAHRALDLAWKSRPVPGESLLVN